MQGARTDFAELMALSKTHTEAWLWEEEPNAMNKFWRSIQRAKAATVEKQTGMPKVSVYWGPTETGKSHMCWMQAMGAGDNTEFYNMCTPTTAGSTPWLDGYEGEEDVIIEDFAGEINYRILLRMFDKYANKMQVKGGMVEFCPKRIWISSNKHPKDWYPAERYEGGPLERRLKGKGCIIKEMKTKWVEPKVTFAEPESDEDMSDSEDSNKLF